MSIFKEGSVEGLSGDTGANWSGGWQFTRNKKQKPAAFAYTHSSQIIPKDLLDYVSFLVDVPELKNPRGTRRDNKDAKSKKKGSGSSRRGRPRKNTSPLASPGRPETPGDTQGAVTANVEGEIEKVEDTLSSGAQVAEAMEEEARMSSDGSPGPITAPSSSSSSSTTAAQPEKDSSVAAEAHDGTQEKEGDAPPLTTEGVAAVGAETDAGANSDSFPRDGTAVTGSTTASAVTVPFNSSSSSSDGVAVASASDSSAISAASVPEKERFENDVTLERTHPMFGLWQGHFQLTTYNSHGKEIGTQQVEETFFFYGFATKEREGAFTKLPEEPLPSAFMEMQVPLHFFPNSPRALAAQQLLDEALAPPVVEPEPTSSMAPVPGTPGATRVLTGASATSGATSSTAPLATPSARPAAASALVNASILVGYGRNQFGRFSLLGVFDEDTSQLRCEKRYMTTPCPSLLARKKSKTMILNTGLDPKEAQEGMLHTKRRRVNSAKARSMIEAFRTGSFDYAHTAGSSAGSRGSHVKGDGDSSGARRARHTQQQRATAQSLARVRALEEQEHERTATYKYASYLEESQEVYEGEWSLGRRHGNGVCLYPDGSLYEGNWLRGREHGRGCLMTHNRSIIYEGEWQDGLMQGKGVYTYANGDVYRGEFREGHRHGSGLYEFKNGCVYQGEWRDNQRHGKGHFSWPDQSYYDGEWDSGFRHGRGILVLSTGFRYDGTFSRNFMDGRGTAVFPSGQQYDGSFKLGLRDGRGSVTFAEGALYEGRFREDHVEGQGTLKVFKAVPGVSANEMYIPVEIQADLKRVHYKAGFSGGHH